MIEAIGWFFVIIIGGPIALGLSSMLIILVIGFLASLYEIFCNMIKSENFYQNLIKVCAFFAMVLMFVSLLKMVVVIK